MPDQIPSAILDSTNSFDSLFALDLDTKQRFDNTLNNIQKPIDYPLPDYNKEMSPKGLPQDDLLNPQKMKGSLGEALFSSDPRIAAYATDKIRANQSKLPISQGIGMPDRFQYDKSMDKFLKGDYGYNPYQSIENNEDFNYRYDYLNQNLAERIFKNIGTGVGRFVGGVALKLGETLGYMGSMIGNGVEEIFNSKNNNFMADVADNSMSRWFEGLETDMKNSNLLSVFKPKGWDDMGFFHKLGNGAMWTDEVADGAAFMGEMVASMYLMGGLGKIGSLGKFGETEINLAKSLGKLGTLGKYTGKTLDFALKTATGAEDLSGIGRWAFSVTSEAAMEASQGYDTSQDQLKSERAAGKNHLSDDEIQAISGDRAAGRFKANLLILSASNAFENKFIFNPLFKRFGKEVPNPRGKLISVSEGTDSLEELARASRKEYSYSTWLGKKLDWKNSNSRLRFYGGRGLSAIAAEGFWEENAQLAVERLAGVDNLSFKTFAQKLKDQTLNALTGKDPEAAENIGLGGVIGIAGTGIVGKAFGGDKLFQGERRKIEDDTQKAVGIYEQYRRNFLNFQDIYVRDENDKPKLDSDGNLEIDDVKAAAMLDGTNAFTSKQEAAAKALDPLFRKHLQDQAMMDYVVAAKNAGIFDRASKRFSALGNLTVGDLQNLGFDPNTTVDPTYLRDSMKQFGKIWEDTEEAPTAKKTKDSTPEDELSRKHAIYKAAATVYSTTKLLGELQSKMLDREFPSAFSPEAEGNTSEIQTYNSLVHQKEALDQWAANVKENGSFYDGFIKTQSKVVDEQMRRLEGIIDGMMENTDLNIQVTPRGFVVSSDKYSHLTPSANDRLAEVGALKEGNERTIAKMKNDVKESKATREIEMNMDIENSAQRKHAQYTNIRAQHQYLTTKFGNVQEGMKNYKEFRNYTDSIQDKDAAEDEKNNPPKQGPGPNSPEGTPTAPVTPTTPVVTKTEPTSVTKKEALSAEAVIIKLTNMLAQNRAVVIVNDPRDSPDYNGIATFIAENIQENRKAIESSISNFIRDPGEVVMDQIRNGTFKIDNASIAAYRVSSEFMDNLMDRVEDEELKNSTFDYMDSVDNAINEYKEPTIELTDNEKAALDALSNINLANTRLAPYAAILDDPNATNKDKKDALHHISDQYLDPKLGIEIGDQLGQAASLAIENLGYPEPKPVDLSEAPAPTTSLEDLAAKAGITEETEATQQTSNNEGKKADESTPELTVGDTVVVDTKKDGESKIKELRGDKALLEDGRQVLLTKLSKSEVAPENGVIEPKPNIEDLTEETTQAEDVTNDTEGSGVQEETPPPPVEPPSTPQVAENSEGSYLAQENFIDVQVDQAKRSGKFVFPQNQPEEIVMEGHIAKVVNGAIQLKTTSGDQQNQLLRQHNILRVMGDRNQMENFFTEDEEGDPKYKVKLELAGFKNEGKYAPWVYNTAKGLVSPVTGKPYSFPYIVAMIADKEGKYVYFDDNGNVSDKVKGKPFGFPYAVEDYKSENLSMSRKGVQAGTREPLNGTHAYLNDNPLADLSSALQKGVNILGSINMVTSGKLSTYNVDNTGQTYAKEPKQRSVNQMMQDGDINDDATFILKTGNFTTYALTTASDTRKQEIKVGQPFLFDEKSGLKLPLRGKLIKDLTVDGKPFITGELKTAIEGLQEDRKIEIDKNDSTPENQQFMENLFNTLRALVYSQNTPIFINEDKTQIRVLDQRPDNKSLMDTEINYSTNISILTNPFETDSEGFSYDEFVKENFLSGAIPAEVTKGEKAFEKLNQRIIFTLDRDHQQVLDSIGATASPQKSLRIKLADFPKFVNKTFKKKGASSTVTITGFSDGKFTIAGPSGTITQSIEEFMKSLPNLEEVKLPVPTEEVQQDFENNIKLSQDEQKELNEKAKNIGQEDIDNMDFNC